MGENNSFSKLFLIFLPRLLCFGLWIVDFVKGKKGFVEKKSLWKQRRSSFLFICLMVVDINPIAT